MTETSINGGQEPAAASSDAAERPAERPSRTSPTAFRPDLEGLRGIAIVAVLMFHAGVPSVGGGFVGVDVFFVLSGFLITGLLVREREERGRVNLAAFYARRARRILPAAVVVIVVTLAASALVLPPLDLVRVAGDAVASALSVGNIRFAADAADYFAAGGQPSPFLHYWSLGVEEQFYLLWPALLILATALGRPRVGAAVALTAILVASFAASLYLTDVAQAWAFYSLPTRAWQLALGGLIAVGSTRMATEGRTAGIVLGTLGWAGLAVIVASAVLIDPTTAYPGTAALLPCLGAAAVILGGAGRHSARLVLELLPLRFLGRISYSLYLVHWPILVLPAAGLAIGDELPLGARIGLALVSVPVGWACYRLVELPVHRGRRFAMRPSRTLALAGATIAAALLVGGAVMLSATRTLDAYASVVTTADGGATAQPETPEPSETSAPTAPPQPSQTTDAGSGAGAGAGAGASSAPTAAATTAPSPNVSPSPAPPSPSAASSASVAPSAATSPTGTPTPSSTPASTATATPAPTPTPKPTRAPPPTSPPEPAGAVPLPPNVQPALSRARDDSELLVHNGCNLQHVQVQPRDCTFGDSAGAITVALVGDSHTSQWFPAVERIAVERGWRLVTFTKYDCRFMDIRMYSAILKREYTECPTWREIVIGRLQALQPQLVIVGVSRFPAVINQADDDAVRQGELLARVLAQVPGKIAILVDTPRFPFDVPGCLSGHAGDVRACAVARATAFLSRHRILERTAAKIAGASLIDLSDTICPWDSCPVVLNGMIEYRDNHHLTATFAASLAEAFAATLPDLP